MTHVRCTGTSHTCSHTRTGQSDTHVVCAQERVTHTDHPCQRHTYVSAFFDFLRRRSASCGVNDCSLHDRGVLCDHYKDDVPWVPLSTPQPGKVLKNKYINKPIWAEPDPSSAIVWDLSGGVQCMTACTDRFSCTVCCDDLRWTPPSFISSQQGSWLCRGLMTALQHLS